MQNYFYNKIIYFLLGIWFFVKLIGSPVLFCACFIRFIPISLTVLLIVSENSTESRIQSSRATISASEISTRYACLLPSSVRCKWHLCDFHSFSFQEFDWFSFFVHLQPSPGSEQESPGHYRERPHIAPSMSTHSMKVCLHLINICTSICQIQLN